MKDIQLFVPTYHIEEVLAEIRQCLESGWTGLGGLTLEFERAWCEYTKLPFAHFTNSCTAALHLAVRLLKEKYGWQDGDEVITTPLSFVSTNHVLLYENLTPVFADVDDYLCLDPASIWNRRTAKTRAVMFVGMGGNVGQLEKIGRMCHEAGLPLIVDAAHMAGTRMRGHMGWAGLGDATCFSFHSVKNLPTADGGMVCFRDGNLDVRARKLSWLGIDKDTYSRTVTNGAYRWQYRLEDVGWKYHGNSIMAAMGLVGLRHLDQDNAYRRQLATWYDQSLINVEKVPVAPLCESSRHLYQILIPERDKVMMALHEHGIAPGVHYDLHTHYPMYRKADCPHAELVSQHLLSLPLHLRMTHGDVLRVSDAMKSTVRKAPI